DDDEDDASYPMRQGPWLPIVYRPRSYIQTAKGKIRLPSHGRVLPIFASEADAAAQAAELDCLPLNTKTGWTLTSNPRESPVPSVARPAGAAASGPLSPRGPKGVHR